MAQIALLAVAAVSAYSQYKQGQEQKEEANLIAQQRDLQAKELEQQAQQEVAAAQRRSMEQQRLSRIAQSRALALAASSGAGATDPTVVNIISDLAGEGAYRAGVEMYQGELNRRQKLSQADALRFEGGSIRRAGASKARAANVGAVTTLFSAGYSAYTGGLFNKYSGSDSGVLSKQSLDRSGFDLSGYR